MSLWTPDGERHVAPSSEVPDPAAPDFTDLDPSEPLSDEDRARAEALAAEMAEVRQQLLGAPAAVVIANHAMGLYELAAIHLGAEKPNLSEAQVAIDAYGALIESVGDRLGPDGATLRDALAQIRLAFVQIKAGADAGSASSPAGPDDGGPEEG